jgi:Phosphoinositide phospholipase C, Ca2+-dependent
MRRPHALLLSLLLLTLLAALPAAADGRAHRVRSAEPRDACADSARALARLEHLRDELPQLAPWARFWLERGVERAVERLARGYADRCVALNQVQVLGTHNSYHIQPVPILINAYLQFDPNAYQLEYTHRPLPEQLELGIRQFELDVFADPQGGLYSEPFGLKLREGDVNARLPGLDAPGLKVLHIQDLDWEVRCPTLIACLGEIEAWSDAHPGHLPIFVLIEVKDDPISDPLGFGFVRPLPFDAEAFDTLDDEIRSVVPAERLITPDDVRGRFSTLEEAVLARGWPKLGEARGKLLFGLDNEGKRDVYRDGRPSLEGRVLFTNAVPGDADAAFVKVNEVFGNQDLIRELVARGYLVRTRADADTIEARTDDTTRRDAALASGAQYVSTDYPEPDPFDGQYVVELPDGPPGRCNPVNAPAGCRAAALER